MNNSFDVPKDGEYYFGFKDEDTGYTFYQQVDKHQCPINNGCVVKSLGKLYDLINISEYEKAKAKHDKGFHLAVYCSENDFEFIGAASSREKLISLGEEAKFTVYDHLGEHKRWAISFCDTTIFIIYRGANTVDENVVYQKDFDSIFEADKYFAKKVNEKKSKGYVHNMSITHFDSAKSVFYKN